MHQPFKVLRTWLDIQSQFSIKFWIYQTKITRTDKLMKRALVRELSFVEKKRPS